MRKAEDLLWIWLLPDAPRETDREVWREHGGKWIIFDRKDRIERLASHLAPLIDSDEIRSAKYWKKDPSAICVYSLDRERDKVLAILSRLDAAGSRVWEYDYATDKNIRDPFTFLYSWYSKLTTILRSYGVRGTLALIREILKPHRP
jgi:hypothetical protein